MSRTVPTCEVCGQPDHPGYGCACWNELENSEPKETLYICEAAYGCGADCVCSKPHSDRRFCDRPHCVAFDIKPKCLVYKPKEKTMANEIVNGQITDAVTQGNPEKLLTFKEVCEAVAKGTPMQYRCGALNNIPGLWKDWSTSDTNIIDMGEYDYRRKPSKTLKPWTFDAPLLGLHIKEKSGSGKGVITYQMKQYVYLSSGIKSYQALLEDYEQLDGRPCGVEVER